MSQASKSVLVLAAVTWGLSACSGDASDAGDPIAGLGGAAGALGGSQGLGGNALGTTVVGGTTSSPAGGSNSVGGSIAAGGATALVGTTGVGGATATGGTKATGGTSAATGGTKATGGTSAATGGTKATGGTSAATGGTKATGGTSSATGGTKATGGTSAATGGTKATGGTSSAAGGSTSSCGVAPVNPNATQATKNVLCYLYQIYKQKTLSGVQDCSWSPISDVTYVYNTTGVYPAIVGGDFLYTNAVSQATTAWNAGSLSMIRYHMGRPEDADSYASSQGTTDLADTLTPGTARYNGLMTKFDHASSELLKLQAAGVVVLWAPFHEVQSGGWFWWAKGTAAQFKQLWNLMFTNFAAKGVNNVIWMLPYSGSPAASHYPGKNVVDISGSDTYGDSQPFTSNYTQTVAAVGSTTMPLALHETGYVPNPTNMFPTAAPWVLFSVWCTGDWVQSTSKNTAAELRQAYVNPLTINRGGMPKF